MRPQLIVVIASLALLSTACAGSTEHRGTDAAGRPLIISVPRDTPTISAAVAKARPGDLVLVSPGVYSFAVTNTGQITVTNAHIVETQFTGHGAAPDISGCPAELGSIAPGAVKTCTVTYIVVPADVDAGLIDNTAIAHGIDPIVADIVSNSSSAQARTVTPLALTGVDSRLDLIVAGLLLSIGALLVLAGRRRRS